MPSSSAPRTCRFATVWGCALAAFLLAGCGGRPARYPVSGRVLIDGKPITTGFVRVLPKGDRMSYGNIEEDGRFTLGCYEQADGCVPGTHAATVTSTTRLTETTRRWNVPRRYADPVTTPLTVTIDGPTSDLKLELSWDGEQHEVEFTGVETDE